MMQVRVKRSEKHPVEVKKENKEKKITGTRMSPPQASGRKKAHPHWNQITPLHGHRDPLF